MTPAINVHVRTVPADQIKYWSMDDIKDANRAVNGHWFDPSTLRFFRSRVGSTVYQGPGGIYFVSSEQHYTSTGPRPRKYTVRQFNPETSGIGTIGEFNVLTRGAAHGLAARMAKGIA